MARTSKRRSDEDDDDNFETAADGTRILKDGARVQVRLMDSRGALGRRPGFIVDRDEYSRDATEVAYHEYDEYLRDAWKCNDRNGCSAGSESDHETTMDATYAAYDRELSETWRRS
jgi:hypothetical protein